MNNFLLGSDGRMRVIKLPSFTKEQVMHLYYEENLGQREVGLRLGVTRKAIRWWMKRWGLVRRPPTRPLSREGDRRVEKRGYVKVWLSSNSPFFPMTKRRRKSPTTSYVPEHRLVMAKHLGRCLQSWEIVHHKDGIRNHNDISNLALVTMNEHDTGYGAGYRQGYQDGQATELRELRAQIKLLQWQVKEGAI